MSELPWNERVPMLSVNPDAASRDDIAKMAAQIMSLEAKLSAMTQENIDLKKERDQYKKLHELASMELAYHLEDLKKSLAAAQSRESEARELLHAQSVFWGNQAVTLSGKCRECKEHTPSMSYPLCKRCAARLGNEFLSRPAPSQEANLDLKPGPIRWMPDPAQDEIGKAVADLLRVVEDEKMDCIHYLSVDFPKIYEALDRLRSAAGSGEGK